MAVSMPVTVFFSWQADTPTLSGRNLVERALERAVAEIGADTELEEAVRDLHLDRDTRGVPGSPPIVETIFKKIDQAAVFVADLTFVGKRIDGRPAPNPNVLIEYGWALKSLTHARIVTVMNEAHGRPAPEAMPFDLRHLRNPITYSCPDDADEDTRRNVRSKLAKELASAIRSVLESAEFKSTLPKPPQRPKYQPVSSSGGAGRFRGAAEPIGVEDGLAMSPGKEVLLPEGPATWLRVMPLYQPDKVWLTTEIANAAKANQGLLLPFSQRASGYSFVRGSDGYGVYGVQRDGSPTGALVYWFKTGEIWSIDADLVNEGQEPNAILYTETAFSKAIESYARFLGRLGIPAPYRWIAGIDGVKGRGIWIRNSILGRPQGTCADDLICIQGEYDPAQTSGAEALRPFFVQVFDSCGLERP